MIQRSSPRAHLAVAVALASLGVLAGPSRSLACSICRCGDPTFNALGKDGYAARGFRIALDWERFDKEEGNPAVSAESQVENRFTALASYGVGETLSLFARVPYSVRDLTVTAPGQEPESTHTSGFSDPELYAQVRLWASGMTSVGRRASVSLNAGVKTPWGQNDVQQDGLRADEHAQPGTGSTDLFASLAFLYLIDRRSAVFVSTAYRHTGGNDFGYRYGSSVLASAAYEHKLGGRLDGVAELDFRHAQRDRVDAQGTLDCMTAKIADVPWRIVASRSASGPIRKPGSSTKLRGLARGFSQRAACWD